jgi:hypothetical protein
MSAHHGMRAGVAQGGLISPVLFGLYVDVPTPSHHVELTKQTEGLPLTLCTVLLPHLPLTSCSYAMTLANK